MQLSHVLPKQSIMPQRRGNICLIELLHSCSYKIYTKQWKLIMLQMDYIAKEMGIIYHRILFNYQ